MAKLTLLTPLGMLNEDGALSAIAAGEFDACDIIDLAEFSEAQLHEFGFAILAGADIYQVWEAYRYPHTTDIPALWD